MSQLFGSLALASTVNNKPALGPVSGGSASLLHEGQGPAGPQPQRLPLIGQQGEDLGIHGLLRQLALALIEQLIG